MLGCLDVKIWRFSGHNRQQTTPIALPLAYARGVNISVRVGGLGEIFLFSKNFWLYGRYTYASYYTGQGTQCSDGKVFNSCGTACPITCTNLDEPRICTRQCVSGCFCPRGTVENGDNGCVDPRDCPSQTTLLPSPSKLHNHSYIVHVLIQK